ncbi:MAG: glycine betaine ABC transporter substrate-binding protein [Polyangia bacterium]
MKRVAIAFLLLLSACGPPHVTVGSKSFTESVLLGEVATQVLRAAGIQAEHRRELGGTRIVWDALLGGRVQVYAEYTGTLRAEIFPNEPDRELGELLAERGIVMSAPLGFADSYAVGMREEVAQRLGIRTLSDLRSHPEVILGLSHEFIERADGWRGLKRRYGLRNEVKGLDHDVAYRALDTNEIGAVDLYSTDAEIAHRHLRVLVDDEHYFPAYQAVLLMRRDLLPAARTALDRLADAISDERMIAMNARVTLEHESERAVAAELLADRLAVRPTGRDPTLIERIARRTWEHLYLVIVSLLAAIVVALPLGVLAAKRRRIGHVVLGAVGILQTVPSLALIVLMIPLLGIGRLPALAAMFLYSLLPIVRNTATGLLDLAPSLRESAEALGLSPWARLRLVELPIAARSILAGIKTSAVLNVGTATLGALIGAGGYGQPILAGIRLDDSGKILEGAIPAALLALFVQWLFELVERFVVRDRG